MTTTAVARPAPPGPAIRARATPRWWAGAGGIATALSLLVVIGLWLHNGGVRQLTTTGPDAMSAVGRLTGLLAADLLLIQVLLMARVPMIERAFGQDRLARWHRWTGFASFHLMLAHVVLITLGYAAAAQTGVIAEFWNLVVSYPGMLLATAGTALLVTVVVTSVRRARRRLRYESWHLLHLYAYLGVGLALPHEVWTGADFTGSPLARAYWWTLYVLAAGAVLVYRLGVPAWRSWRHRLTVSHVVLEGPGLTSVYLTGRRLDRLPVRAGQFFQWRFLDGPGWSRAHPYSLSATPRTDLLRITVKDLGDGSTRIAGLRPGTRAVIEGPYGRLTGQTYTGGPVVLIGCGIGITPLLAMLGELPYQPGEATLIYRARSQAEVAFRGELDWFARHRGVQVLYLLGPRSDQPSWLPGELAGHGDTAMLCRITPDLTRAQVYVCGPDAWTAAVRTAATVAGVTADRLHTEQFAW